MYHFPLRPSTLVLAFLVCAATTAGCLTVVTEEPRPSYRSESMGPVAFDKPVDAVRYCVGQEAYIREDWLLPPRAQYQVGQDAVNQPLVFRCRLDVNGLGISGGSGYCRFLMQ